MQENNLIHLVILLAVTVTVVVLLRRLRLPTIIAYLLTGLLVGPHGLNWIPDNDAIRVFAEYGVVFLLFTLGLEFSLPRLLIMKREVLVLGGAQVVVTTIVAMLLSRFFGVADEAAIIIGGAEAWMLADELATANVSVIIDGTANLPGNFDRINARLESGGILAAAGVRVAFGAGAQTHQARNITQSAGNAVANGMEWDDALAAITLAPAQMYGVDAEVGSIEVGKAADLVIWGADPLELTSYPEQVFIQGESISMESRQTLLRDRYLQTATDKPPAFRN